MPIGISKTFPMDLDLIARLMQFYGERPAEKPDAVAKEVGLNRPKVDGLNKLMGYLGLQQERKLTPFGELILENDPYLRDIGTYCALHYRLCGNRDAEVWYFASNQFIPQHRLFTRDEFVQAIRQVGIGQGNTRLRADQSLFLNAYTNPEHHALQALQYLSEVEGAGETYRATTVEKLPALVLGFGLYEWRTASPQIQTVSINNLLNLDGQVGKMFLLTRGLLMERLQELESRGLLGITQVADLDNITFAHLDDPLSLLAEYFRDR